MLHVLAPPPALQIKGWIDMMMARRAAWLQSQATLGLWMPCEGFLCCQPKQPAIGRSQCDPLHVFP